jgi:hypothetical protein
VPRAIHLALTAIAMGGTACVLGLPEVEPAEPSGGGGGAGATSAGGGAQGGGGAGGDAAGGGGTGATGGTGAAGAGGSGGGLDPYATEVLSDAPVGYWRLNERNTPDAFDASGYDHHGVYTGGVTLLQPGIVAVDPCAAFDGTNGAVTLNEDILDFAGTARFSVEAWIDGSDGDGYVVGKMSYDGAYHGWMLTTDPSGPGMRFQRHPASGVVGGAVVLDEWNHVVGTYDGSTLRLYLNGQEVSNKASTSTLEDIVEPLVVSDGASWGAYQGRIDEVAVYETNLSAARVLAHYEAGIAAN